MPEGVMNTSQMSTPCCWDISSRKGTSRQTSLGNDKASCKHETQRDLPVKSSSWTMRSLVVIVYSDSFCEAFDGDAAGDAGGAAGATAGALGLCWSGAS